MNLYAYAGGNPTNFVDPLGTTQVGITQLRNTFTQQRSYTTPRRVTQGNRLSFTQIGTLSQELNNAIGTVGALASLSPQGRGVRAAVTLGTKLKKVFDAAKGLGQSVKTRVNNLVQAGKKVFGVGASKTEDILVLGRKDGLSDFASKEGGRLSTTSGKSAKEIYKQNARDIRSADRIIFREKGVPNSLQDALNIGGGQFSRAERMLIESRPELRTKTIFK